MKNISSFLSKFTRITPPERFVKEVFVKVVSDTTGITLSKNEINVKGSVLFISPDPTVKSELFLKKDLLLEKLNQELTQYKKEIKDIR